MSIYYFVLMIYFRSNINNLKSINSSIFFSTDTTIEPDILLNRENILDYETKDNRNASEIKLGAKQEIGFSFERHNKFSMIVEKTKCKSRDKKRRLPSGLIIGERKCGTSAMMVFLTFHPQLAVLNGEGHYFDNKRYLEPNSLEKHIKRMPLSCPEDVTVEKSPRYFRTPVAAERIYMARKSMRCVLIVRDPVARLISAHAMAVRCGHKAKLESIVFRNSNGTKTVNPKADFVRFSLYANSLQRWLKLFPREQFLIIDGDKFVFENPAPQLRRVAVFLGVEPYFNETMFTFNREKGYFCPPSGCLPKVKGHHYTNVLSKADLTLLRHYFEPYNKEFYLLAEEDLGWASD